MARKTEAFPGRALNADTDQALRTRMTRLHLPTEDTAAATRGRVPAQRIRQTRPELRTDHIHTALIGLWPALAVTVFAAYGLGFAERTA